LEILRLRAFAHAWQDEKRERREDETAPSGTMHDWVVRIQQRLLDSDAQAALADMRALRAS
jgi:hypothetical protein